ncbi:hypothetical protein G9A89_000948 [Geosiphon pyriformis]|nr:hypothetical protein G9A89_000948 [Geosiphon pyriformis]
MGAKVTFMWDICKRPISAEMGELPNSGIGYSVINQNDECFPDQQLLPKANISTYMV